MRKKKHYISAAQNVQEMAAINYLTYVEASQLQFIDEKKQRDKENEQEEIRRKLAEKKGQKVPKRRDRSPRKPHELSPRKRPLDAPPSPTKQKIEKLRAEQAAAGGGEGGEGGAQGYQQQERVRIDRPLSPARTEQINTSFRESDKLRQEAKAQMSNFTSQMDNAKQYIGNTKREPGAGEGEVLPSFMNKWYTEMAFVPPHHMHGENEQILKLQHSAAHTQQTMEKLTSMSHTQQTMSRLQLR